MSEIPISKIIKTAKSLNISLKNNGRGRPCCEEADQINNRNLLMLAIYETGRKGEGTGNNYGGNVTKKDLQGLFEIGSNTVSVALRKARRVKESQGGEYKQIIKLLKA